MNKLRGSKAGQILLVTIGTLFITVGVYFFKFPNNFCFGGVTGIAVVLGRVTVWSPGLVTFFINVALLITGYLLLGKDFGLKTVYSSLLMSGLLWLLEQVYPLQSPLTEQPVLEFALAVFLPAIGAALLFNIGASNGGTDIIAMILRKHTGLNVGNALLAVDFIITAAAFLCFDIQTGLFAFAGLMTKTFVINGAIESFNLSKFFNIICDDPDPICKFINEELKRGATVSNARGSFTNKDKYIVFTALRRSQALQLRNFVRRQEPHAFIMILNSSEVIGQGFQTE